MTASPNPHPAAVILPFTPKRKGPCVDPKARGYVPAYHGGETNRCPGCGRAHWYVGRLSAECAFCGCAVPLAGGRP